MTDSIANLLQLIGEEIELHGALAEHARRKTLLLAQGNSEAIQDANRTEEALAGRLRELQTCAKSLCAELASRYQIPSSGFSLEKLARRVDESSAQKIRSLISRFRGVAGELKAVNERNRRISEKALHYSRGLVALMGNSAGAYQPNGLFEQALPAGPAFSTRA